MKIAQVEVIPLARKLETPFEGGTYRIDNHYTLVTRVYADNGAVGQIFGGDEFIFAYDANQAWTPQPTDTPPPYTRAPHAVGDGMWCPLNQNPFPVGLKNCYLSTT